MALSSLEIADRVWAYRRDVLSPQDRQELETQRVGLRAALKGNATPQFLAEREKALLATAQRCGGKIFPQSSLTEWIEFVVVAAIVIVGIHTYFLQMFSIPTNSMWPTYAGMVGENFPPSRPAPGPVARAWRFATLGATRYEVRAPRSGQLSALFFNSDYLAFSKTTGRKWVVLPTDVRRYVFLIDGEPVNFDVPVDFGEGPGEHAGSFEDLFIDTFFGSRAAFAAYWAQHQSQLMPRPIQYEPGTTATAYELPLGRSVQAGDVLMRFDILAGDHVVVDRFTYHFFPPKVGQGFVFATKPIARIGKDDNFIKRLVGVPGDTLQIKPPVLYRNGSPITGSAIFRLNNEKVAPYTGYADPPPAPQGFFPAGGKLVVPPASYVGMGDNSSNSEDSRYWGFIPREAVIGRPVFIDYPFTKRWGPAK